MTNHVFLTQQTSKTFKRPSINKMFRQINMNILHEFILMIFLDILAKLKSLSNAYFIYKNKYY